MMTRITMRRLLATAIAPALVLVFAAVIVPTATGEGDASQTAREILDASGVKAGLIVHVGCGDGELTAALHAADNCVVHGLDTAPGDVRRAREYIRNQRNYGPVSVDRFDGEHLPYADNIVDLIVAEDPGGVTRDEAMRVLAPGGVLYAKDAEGWQKAVKPRPANIDEWTHYLHDESGNPVAHDDLVGPPRRLQWTAGPRHGRSHEHTPSTSTVVSANGRIFYIHDDGPIAAVQQPSRWYVVARDAFNGILLWKRPIETWVSQLMIWTWTPKPVQRRMVAVGDRVYVTLGFHAPVSVLDAATGETLKVYEGTGGTEEIICHNGVLVLSVKAVTDERVSALERLIGLGQQEGSPLFKRETNQPVVREFRKPERSAKMSVMALEADTGDVLWEKSGDDTAGLAPLSLCAIDNRVLYRKQGNVMCLDLKTGEQIWAAPWAPIRLVEGDKVICVNNKIVKALSVQSGKTLWEKECSLAGIRDAFVAGGDLWVGGFKPVEDERSPAWGSYFAVKRDLATGEKLDEIEAEDPEHHHRCYINKATDRYILSGRRGTEFLDLQTGEVYWNCWARGVCMYGVMPCNGLMYAPPHACGCYTTAKLEGFNALSAAEPADPAHESDQPAVERGPAYDAAASAPASPSADDWPMYRRDAARSGCTMTSVPTDLETKWTAKVGPTVSSPTIAGDNVFVACRDQHEVRAIDADSGRARWRFTAGGRVDTPPTLHGNRAVFGCRDGYVYSLRASDGTLAWRLRAARADRRTVVREQVESLWPVFGSVLIDDGTAYFTAGRNSYLDGGMDLYAVDPHTGVAIAKTVVYSPDPETGRQPEQLGPWGIPGSRADILTADDDHIYLRQMVFDRQCKSQEKGNAHLLTVTDFLDDTWSHRSYWILGTDTSLSTGCSGRRRNLLYGRLLVFDDSTAYGYGRRGVHWSNQLQDGEYRVFARKRGEKENLWEQSVAVHVRAMVLVDGVIFVAGPKPKHGADRWFQGESDGGMVVALSASDGTILGQSEIDGTPIFDGMAAARGRLYVSLEDGRVVCLGGG